MENILQDNVVDMVRTIRDRHYEETKHMTREERLAHVRKEYAEAEKAFGSISTSKSYSLWLCEQERGKIYGK